MFSLFFSACSSHFVAIRIMNLTNEQVSCLQPNSKGSFKHLLLYSLEQALPLQSPCCPHGAIPSGPPARRAAPTPPLLRGLWKLRLCKSEACLVNRLLKQRSLPLDPPAGTNPSLRLGVSHGTARVPRPPRQKASGPSGLSETIRSHSPSCGLDFLLSYHFQ